MHLGPSSNTHHDEIIYSLHILYSAHQDLRKAKEMSAYMRNKFSFYGIQSVQRKALSKQFLKTHKELDVSKVTRACFAAEGRELQYFVNDWLKPQAQKLDPELLPLLEELIVTQSWWDTVDFLAPSIAGIILKTRPDLWKYYPEKWIKHENIWLKRSAILFQLKYKQDTDDQTLFRYCKMCAHEQEFFIQKAMGWALRERSKTNPEAVLKFLKDSPMPTLSDREARKWLKKQEQP